MAHLLAVFTQICLPAFVLIGLGWLLDRRFRLHLDSLVKLNLQLFVPSFIFVQLVESPVPGGVAARVFLFTASMILLMLALATATAAALRWPREEARALQLSAMFQNAGNFGIPLMALAYPGRGPALEVFVIAAVNISTFTLGVFIASAGASDSRGWRRLLPVLRQASVWAIAAAFAVRHFQIPLTEWNALWVPLVYLKSGLVAIALATLGVQLSQTGHRASAFPKIGIALLLRLLVAPALAIPLAWAFGFQGVDARIVILSAAFPTAVNTALIAHEFKAAPKFAASVVFYSTLAGALTVTLVVAVLQAAPG